MRTNETFKQNKEIYTAVDVCNLKDQINQTWKKNL